MQQMLKRANLTLLALIFICSILCSFAAQNRQKSDWLVYNGLFFEIKYPSSFSIRPGTTQPRGKGCNSAFFTSADKAVEFYVFSPQWDGNLKEINFDPKKEVRVSLKNVQNKTGSTIWTTIRARGKSYTRSIVAKINKHGGTTLAFQIKYRDARSYAKYKDCYMKFKSSVVVNRD